MTKPKWVKVWVARDENGKYDKGTYIWDNRKLSGRIYPGLFWHGDSIDDRIVRALYAAGLPRLKPGQGPIELEVQFRVPKKRKK